MFKNHANDMIDFDAKLHIEQLDAILKIVDQGLLVPELVVMGNLLEGKKVNTKRFIDRRKIPYVGKERRCETGGLSKP